MTLYTGETTLAPSSQLFATINLDAIAHNVGVMQRFAGDTQLMAVVKADAYGHGAIEVSKTALDAGAVELGCGHDPRGPFGERIRGSSRALCGRSVRQVAGVRQPVR